MIFDDSVNENKALLKIYSHVWDGIKNEIKAINGGKENNCGKDDMKIKFDSDDDLSLNKPLKLLQWRKLSDLFLKEVVNFIRRFF